MRWSTTTLSHLVLTDLISIQSPAAGKLGSPPCSLQRRLASICTWHCWRKRPCTFIFCLSSEIIRCCWPTSHVARNRLDPPPRCFLHIFPRTLNGHGVRTSEIPLFVERSLDPIFPTVGSLLGWLAGSGTTSLTAMWPSAGDSLFVDFLSLSIYSFRLIRYPADVLSVSTYSFRFK